MRNYFINFMTPIYQLGTWLAFDFLLINLSYLPLSFFPPLPSPLSLSLSLSL